MTRTGFCRVLFGISRGPFLLEQNQILRNQLATALAHEETHRQLSMENGRLRALLDFKAKSSWRMVPAEVIGREMSLWSRTLLLNRGTRDGIENGMAVITPVGLVGQISEAGGSASRVVLMTDPHFRVAGTLARTRTFGLITGNASGECLLTYLPLNADLKSGEPVLTTGGRSFCPEGIPVGTVQAVNEDSSRLFLSARIQPAVNLSALDEVLIVERVPPSESDP